MKTKNTLYGIITAALLFALPGKSNAAVNVSTYTITIHLKELTTLVPVAGATIVLNSETKLSDIAGDAVFIVPAGCLDCIVKYYYTVNKYGYNNINDSISLKADKPVTIIMKPITYNVVFIVSDGLMPIQGAQINFDNKMISVNSSGFAEFLGVRLGENLPFTITKAYFKTIIGTLTVNDNMSRTFYMTPEGTNIISFYVKKAGDELPIEGSRIFFNGDTGLTDVNGRAIFSNASTGSTLQYEVYKTGFNLVRESIFIDNDITTTVLIDSLHVHFLVTDGVNYIKNADVLFKGKTLNTNDTGTAVFRGITEGKGIAYQVSKEGYNNYSGTIDVDSFNVHLTVIMIIKSITPPEGMAGQKGIDLSIYPNPVRGDIFISSGETIKSVQIVGILGQTVKTINNPANNTIQISTDDMRTGMYLIKVVDGNNRISVFRIVKE